MVETLDRVPISEKFQKLNGPFSAEFGGVNIPVNRRWSLIDADPEKELPDNLQVIITFHGYACGSNDKETYFDPLLQALAKKSGSAVLACSFDWPGYGHCSSTQEVRKRPEAYTVEAQAGFIPPFMTQFDKDLQTIFGNNPPHLEVDIISHSMGARSALRAFSDPSLKAFLSKMDANFSHIALAPALALHENSILQSSVHILEFVKRMTSSGMMTSFLPAINWAINNLSQGPVELFMQTFGKNLGLAPENPFMKKIIRGANHQLLMMQGAELQENFIRALGEPTIPTLVVLYGDDRMVSNTVAISAMEGMSRDPDCPLWLMTVPGAQHTHCLTHPKEVAEYINYF